MVCGGRPHNSDEEICVRTDKTMRKRRRWLATSGQGRTRLGVTAAESLSGDEHSRGPEERGARLEGLIESQAS